MRFDWGLWLILFWFCVGFFGLFGYFVIVFFFRFDEGGGLGDEVGLFLYGGEGGGRKCRKIWVCEYCR